MTNLYFLVLANSTNEADAISEAYKLAKVCEYDKMGVEVHEWGTKRLIANVLKDGSVSIPKSEGDK